MVMMTSSSMAALALIAYRLQICFSFLLYPALMRQQRNICLYQNLDDRRNMLESFWNLESMGQVPNSPQSAAEEAAASIIGAHNDGLGNVCFVDLLLPQYDIQQGINRYDEVEAVDFCRLLANCLQTRSVIYVKDEKSLNSVAKIIDARERERREQQTLRDEYEYIEEEVEIESDGLDMEAPDVDVDDDDDDNKSAQGVQSLGKNDIEIFNEFSDFASADVDTFFSLDKPDSPQTSDSNASQNLLHSGSDDAVKANNPLYIQKKSTKMIKKLVKCKVDGAETTRAVQPPTYRLASLFGDKPISSGATMSDSVVQALKAHGIPMDEEETMILLSANSEEEMLAIRALVSKYGGKKKIVLVNCKLDPLPLELEDCHTVYHLTPLIATTMIDPADIFNTIKRDGQERQPIKVVSIRRYPGDWEVFVDIDGSGFELAQRTPAKKFAKKGPSFDWIGGAIKAFLSLRSRSD